MEKAVKMKAKPKALLIIKSFVKTTTATGYAFRTYQYATAWIQLLIDQPAIEAGIDSCCGMTLADKDYIKETLPNIEIKKMLTEIAVKKIRSSVHQYNLYIIIDIFIERKLKSKPALGQITKEIHLVKNLRAKVLLGLDVLAPERMTINIWKKLLIIKACNNLAVPIQIAPNPKAHLK